MTVIDGSIFLKNVKTTIWEKNVRRGYYFYLGVTIMKLWLTLKHTSIWTKRLFELFCIENEFTK